MNVLVTGCAGFIGFHICLKLSDSYPEFNIFGIDNLNDYYDVNLKKIRLKELKKKNKKFCFIKKNISNYKLIIKDFRKYKFDYVFHMAAQAGVRYSISRPEVYFQSNLLGFFNILESCRKTNVKHLIYASSSSVYGNNERFPLNENLNTDTPLSFYAATKKSNEVMAYSYSHIYRLPTTGLRFFTVYGSYGRPDMSLFKFVSNILNNKISYLFNKGNHERDFTHIDDVLSVLLKIMQKPSKSKTPFDILNIGSNSPTKLKKFVKIIEKTIGKKLKFKLENLQTGDVKKTHADISKIKKKYGYQTKKSITAGIKEFIEWYKKYKNDR